jgi:hypothetical protein
MDRTSCFNLWLVEDGPIIHGLVHPETREEAESEMARLGITGTLMHRDSVEFKAIQVLRPELANPKD